MPPCPVVFLGTPGAAVTVLDALVSAGHPVPLVVTGADKRRGRGGSVSASPVKQRAEELGLSVTHDLADITHGEFGQGAVGVVVAYGRIIPRAVLDALPMLNVHFSLLPRWRGAAPVERAILAGDETTGVCIMEVEEGLDTGAVHARKEIPVDGHDAVALTELLATEGAHLLCRVLAGPAVPPEPQSGDATYARKIGPADLEIDWNEDAVAVLRRIRAVPAHTAALGRRLRIVAAEDAGSPPVPLAPGELAPGALVGTADGAVRLLRVVPESRREMAADEWVRGLAVPLPLLLGSPRSGD
jgi:methionyl-tRNA formyltransferase